MKFCALALVLGSAAASVSFAADPILVERIVAKVNGDIITSAELERELRSFEAQLQGRGANAQQIQQEVEKKRPNVLRDRIDTLLLINRAKDLNINVDAEVTKLIGKIQADNKIADPDAFQKWIREQSGMSFEDFKSEYRNSMLTQRVIGQEVSSKISMPTATLQKYYEEHKSEFMRKERVFIREILVTNEGRTPEEAEKKAKDLVARARKGERFPELARDNSDAVTARDGGMLGAFEKNDLSTDIVNAVWDKEKNYVSDPIKVSSGWIIIRVDDHHKEGQAGFEEVENEIRQRLYEPLYEPKIREYLTQLRLDAFLEIREGYIDTGAAPGKNTAWQDPAMLRPETVTKEEVANQTRRKRLLWLIPIPGTSTQGNPTSTSK